MTSDNLGLRLKGVQNESFQGEITDYFYPAVHDIELIIDVPISEKDFKSDREESFAKSQEKGYNSTKAYKVVDRTLTSTVIDNSSSHNDNCKLSKLKEKTTENESSIITNKSCKRKSSDDDVTCDHGPRRKSFVDPYLSDLAR